MNPFGEARKVEAESWPLVEPHLREWFREGEFFLFHDEGEPDARNPFRDTPRDSIKDLQAICDGVARCRDGSLVTVEFKAEKTHTGNLFLETDSNLSLRRYRAGWLASKRFHFLVYHFLDTGNLYGIHFYRLQDWLDERIPIGNGGRRTAPRLLKYRRVPQGAYEQFNATCGVPVPIQDIRDAGNIVLRETIALPQAVAISA